MCNVPDPLAARGVRGRCLNDKEGSLSENRGRFMKFLIGAHEGPDPAKKVTRCQLVVARCPDLCKFLYTMFVEK